MIKLDRSVPQMNRTIPYQPSQQSTPLAVDPPYPYTKKTVDTVRKLTEKLQVS